MKIEKSCPVEKWFSPAQTVSGEVYLVGDVPPLKDAKYGANVVTLCEKRTPLMKVINPSNSFSGFVNLETGEFYDSQIFATIDVAFVKPEVKFQIIHNFYNFQFPRT